MATDAVTAAARYPELPVHELTSEQGTSGRFAGRIIARGMACRTCGTSDSMTVYQGPQVAETPIDRSPAEVEMSWCTEHGLVGMRLINADGSEHQDR